MLSKHSSKLEYSEFRLSYEVDELFLLEGETFDGDFTSGYFLALNDKADGDFDWFWGDYDFICYTLEVICKFFFPNLPLIGKMIVSSSSSSSSSFTYCILGPSVCYSSSSLIKFTKLSQKLRLSAFFFLSWRFLFDVVGGGNIILGCLFSYFTGYEISSSITVSPRPFFIAFTQINASLFIF
jgi:hypothetical protein